MSWMNDSGGVTEFQVLVLVGHLLAIADTSVIENLQLMINLKLMRIARTKFIHVKNTTYAQVCTHTNTYAYACANLAVNNIC